MSESPMPFGLNAFADVTGAASFLDLLPATYRTKTDEIVFPCSKNLSSILDHDLLVHRLNCIHSWLWMCGRPMPPRAMHKQMALSRTIVLTEDMDMHLLWLGNRIFIKPLPLYLLHSDFWNKHNACFLTSGQSDPSPTQSISRVGTQGLLPPAMTWEQWRNFSSQFLSQHCYFSINPRFWYGELGLNRLNMIYSLAWGLIFRGYSRVGGAATYEELIRHNFAALATILAYAIVVLSAMQTGLSTDRLQSDQTFVNASYGFTVFSIIAPLTGVVIFLLGLLCLVLYNWDATNGYEAMRFNAMVLELPRRQDPFSTNTSP
ncbi:uncharacterized protein N7483_005040 [Penicillium malachiteum]|uniref:uncharacterized protein n=1 Tax=Penicillium malachiteum TaxID=1324776 RepID=UPI002546E896|nr:uncharacterized protein N7483_005040 [Penicillium malachiteum]KAJ5730532.1 hypothetical protein N7483_005040 [Penicillium malachiteum]